MSWTLELALDFIRRLAPSVQLAGFDLALAGSVLKNGSSTKDLDLICFPLNSSELSRVKLNAALLGFGLTRRWKPWEIHKFWDKQGSNDLKSVEVWFTEDGKRVDLFLLR